MSVLGVVILLGTLTGAAAVPPVQAQRGIRALILVVGLFLAAACLFGNPQ